MPVKLELTKSSLGVLTSAAQGKGSGADKSISTWAPMVGEALHCGPTADRKEQ